MSCTSMNNYRDLVSNMTTQQKTTAAISGYTIIDNLTSDDKDIVVLGLCSVSDLYSVTITDLAEIGTISGIDSYVSQASDLNDTEKLEAGFKSFFTVSYMPTVDRDAIFTGYFASASLSDVDIDSVAAAVVNGPKVGRADPIW